MFLFRDWKRAIVSVSDGKEEPEYEVKEPLLNNHAHLFHLSIIQHPWQNFNPALYDRYKRTMNAEAYDISTNIYIDVWLLQYFI